MKSTFMNCGCNRLLILLFILVSCDSTNNESKKGNPDYHPHFPEFITPVAGYFDISITSVPEIDSSAYTLTVTGEIDTLLTLSLDDLRNRELIERTVTIECIENPANGDLIGTATWKGFRVIDLLNSAGIKEGASVVRYTCADGYYTYNTLQELEERDVLGALWMNGEPLTPTYGFPLRIIFPGFYGVRQPGWIIEMDVMNTMEEDFWSKLGWHTDSSMTVDSKIFFPPDQYTISVGETIRIGGAAYGSKRIARVDITTDNGLNWSPATIIQTLDEDYVWVFWEAYVTAHQTGILIIRSRATDQEGKIQIQEDEQWADGINAWPSVSLPVVESLSE